MKYKQGTLHYEARSGKTFTCTVCGDKATSVKVREDDAYICICCFMKDEESKDMEIAILE